MYLSIPGRYAAEMDPVAHPDAIETCIALPDGQVVGGREEKRRNLSWLSIILQTNTLRLSQIEQSPIGWISS
jgi:hypothetical protein